MTEPTEAHLAVFTEHRTALLGAAYRVLGTVQDSEDVVQETWLRWQQVDVDAVRDPRSYLLRIVTRSALNNLRTQQRRREEYPGPWLPEPVSTDTRSDPGNAAEVADEVSLALLVVLDELSPLERAAFVLREVFGTSYAEVADALDRSEAAVRKLVSRARAHVREAAPRQTGESVGHRELTEKLLAVSKGQVPMEDFISALAPDVVLTTDAGGRAKAALRPITGAEKVLRFAAGVLAKPEVMALSWSVGEINGGPALIGWAGETIDAVVWVETDGRVITRVDMVRNPEKLRGVRLSPDR